MTARQDEIIICKYTNTYGNHFRCSRRTEAHLTFTISELKRRYSKARLYIIQGCYNSTVAASAGTHDYDAVLDFRIVGLGWWEGQRFLRECGWEAYYRHTGSWAAMRYWHFHSTSGGFRTKVGLYIDGGLSIYGRIRATSQNTDWFRRALGLANQHTPGGDTSWHPSPSDKYFFDFDKWEEETDVALSDADKKWIKETVETATENAAEKAVKNTIVYGKYGLANTIGRIARKLKA